MGIQHHEQWPIGGISVDKLVNFNQYLSSKWFVTLGNRVWKQIVAIPMGFSCSPLWCNLCLLQYEASFITRLAKLGRVDLMKRFRYLFWYIDDLFILNNGHIWQFLDPNSERVPSNPFWIYPLHIVEIKSEIDGYGMHAHINCST